MSDLIDKVKNEEELSFDDACNLYDLDFFTLGKLAYDIRFKKHKRKTYFNINRHLNPTNKCKDTCKFCAYSASRKNPDEHTYSKEESLSIVKDAVESHGATEIHIVSAHNNTVSLDWYLDPIREIKSIYGNSLHIKAFSAAEINFLAEKNSYNIDEMVKIISDAGVDSLPGGGAEIFDEKIRDEICHSKVSSQGWLDIHKAWHKLGKKSNATMLFGHIESRKHRVDHMLRLKKLQSETGGFNAFIPLTYQIYNTYLDVKRGASGHEIIKTIAVARIILENFPHIKSYWATNTLPISILSQEFGADDVDGTLMKESIQSRAGANSASGVSQEILIDLIKDANFIPVERDSMYNELKIYN